MRYTLDSCDSGQSLEVGFYEYSGQLFKEYLYHIFSQLVVRVCVCLRKVLLRMKHCMTSKLNLEYPDS